jgi:hypothetical protein
MIDARLRHRATMSLAAPRRRRVDEDGALARPNACQSGSTYSLSISRDFAKTAAAHCVSMDHTFSKS